jgi:lipopolysaccharide-binding protein
VCLVSCVSFDVHPRDTLPGLKLSIAQSSLTYISNTLLPIIEKQVQSLNIPDHKEDVHTPVGKVTLEVKNMKVQQLHLSNADLKVANNGLQVVISNCNIAMHLDWHYKRHGWPHVSDHGSADVKMTINLSLLIAITVGADGKPVVTVPSSSADVTHFDLKLHGGASWLYNIFIKVFKGDIRKSITKAIENNMSKAVTENVAKVLATIQLKYPIRDGIYVDMSFVEMLFKAGSFMTAGNKGQFIFEKGPAFPGKPIVIPDYDPRFGASMIQIAFSEFVLNSATWTGFYAEPTRIIVDQKTLPPIVAPLLNTASFQFLIPQLYKTFPDLVMQISIGATIPPTTRIDPSIGCEIAAEGDAQFQVVQKNGTIATAFVLGLSLSMDTKVKIADNLITATMSLKNTTLKLKESIVGQFDVSVLDSVTSAAFKYVVVPYLNQVAEKGFPIPTVKGLTLVQPSLAYLQNYIQIYSNFTFSPSSW